MTQLKNDEKAFARAVLLISCGRAQWEADVGHLSADDLQPGACRRRGFRSQREVDSPISRV